MSLRVQYQKIEAIPEGIYRARLDKIAESKPHPTYGEGYTWTFTILDGEHEGSTVGGLCSNKMSAKSKLFSWVTGFGEMLDPGESFDLGELIGRTVKIRVKNTVSKKTVEGKEIVTTYSNVEAIGPDKKKSSAAAAAPAKPAAKPVAKAKPPVEEDEDDDLGLGDAVGDDDDDFGNDF